MSKATDRAAHNQDMEQAEAERALLRAVAVEHRTIDPATAGISVRHSAPSGPGTFDGYAAVFNSRTWIGFGSGPEDDAWGFFEEIAPGAFTEWLADKNNDVVCLFNHDINQLLGRRASGTLVLNEDDHGLHSVDTFPNTQLGRDTETLVERGDITGMSFAFIPTSETWSQVDGADHRRVNTAELYDVSPVVMPAYPDTSAGMRAARMGRRNGPPVVGRAKHTHPAEGDGEALTHEHNNDDPGHTHEGYLPLGGPREAVDEPTEERAIEHEIDGEELDLWLHRLAWLHDWD